MRSRVRDRYQVLAAVAGAAVAALGVLVLLGWAFEIGALKTVLPGLVSMEANTALAFVLSGLALFWLSTRAGTRAAVFAASGVLAIALATLAEYWLEVALGIDQLLFRDPDTPAALFPGRMAQVTAVAFATSATALFLALARAPLFRVLARGLAVGVTVFGGLTVLAYLLGFEFLIRAQLYQTGALHTAVGFLVLGGGLSFALRPREPIAEDRRIGGLAALLLAFAACATGLVAFATIGRQVQGILEGGLTSALAARTQAIGTNFDLRTTRAEIIASRPNMLRHLRLLVSEPSHPEYRAVVRGVLESFLPHGFSGIAVTLPSGWEVARAGAFITWPALEARAEGPADMAILWREGIYLRHRLPMWDAEGPLGTILAEQFLPNLTRLLQDAASPWPSAELLLCFPSGPVFRCFPSRHEPIPFTIAPDPGRGPARLVFRAWKEGAGFGHALDFRERSVLGAYDRLRPLGLAAVFKVDVEEIYAPAARSFGFASLLTLLVAGLGAFLVQLRVRPLASDLEARVRERTQALESARAEVADLYEHAPDLYLSVEVPSARILRCNESLLRATGYSREEILGKSLFDLYHPEDRAEARRSFARFQEWGELRDLERRILRKDGSVMDVSLSATAVRDAGGGIRYSRSSFRDITEQKLLQARFGAVVESMPSGLIAVDESGRIVLVNRQAERLFGYTREELVGERVERLVLERFRAGHLALREGFMARAEARPMGAGRELYGRRKDGGEFRLEIGLSPVAGDGGRMVLAAVIDITDRVRLEQERRSQELLRVFLDAAPIMMWMTDANGRAQMFNGEWLRFTGRTLEEELAVPWTGKDIHPEDRPACLAAYHRHLKAHTKLAHAYRVKDRNGDYRWIEEVAVPRFDPAGGYEGHVGCCVDVTERMQAEDQIVASLKEKEVLLAEVHHRVKNNLAVIASLLSLQSRGVEDPALRELLAESEARVQAMALIHQVLYESRDFARVDLGDYLGRLVRLAVTAYHTDPGRIAISVEAEPVSLDLTRAIPCGLLVNELLSNALKHAFPGGRRGAVRVALRALAGGEALLAVGDDGVGLPEGIAPGETATLWLKLAPLLARQIEGTLILCGGPGTRYELRFRYASRIG